MATLPAPSFAVSSSTNALPLMEEFYSIQGEGCFTGHAAYFIRLAGCDVGCVWCDVKESWDAGAHGLAAANDIVARAKASGTQLVIITGGEPALYDLSTLTRLLQQNHLKTHIETSGAHKASGSWDWVCLSPKKFKAPDDTWIALADELKIVVYHKSDFDWAESFARRVRPDCKLLLQPEWSKQSEVLPLIIDYVKRFPQWNISLQTHKYMNVR